MGHPRERAVPELYGRYQLLFRIAAGGMAEVYAARVHGAAGFEKLVALKRMLPHLTDDDRFVSMFMDEGRLAANISSPHVVSTLDLGRAADESLYLVMELVVGTTLSSLLRNVVSSGQKMPVDVAVEMIAQAAQGLHDAHEARTPHGEALHIVHRDVSPQNILVGLDGRVRITDFGVARAVMRRTKTSTGEFKGKLSYFSPEQCADQELDRRSDLFSLGVVAWETLTMRRLFHAENPLAVLERVTRMAIPAANSVNPEVPAEVAAVVAKALARSRDERFDTGRDFARELRAAAVRCGAFADSGRVASFVGSNGGEALERMRSQLKASVDNPRPLPDDVERVDAQTELSSGIVFRPEDGPATELPATPPPFATAAAIAPPAPIPATGERGSRLPLIALLSGLVILGGAGVGVAAGLHFFAGETEKDPSSASEPTEALAPRPTDALAVEETPATRDPGNDTEVPEPDEPSDATLDDDEGASPRPARTGRRPARRRPPSTPTPTPYAQRPSVTPSPAPSTTRPPPSAPARTTERRRPGGLVGLSDFDRDIGRQ